jgi:glycosyltransferase involved in cell wall biosynthesis
MDKLSAIIITKNEEQNIKDCLEGVKWADEIIVVDDESEDRTVEICREYSNVKVYEKKMEGFGPQKNYALSKATGEWVLSIDADERVTPQLKDEILQKIDQAGFDGYYFRRNNLVFGKWLMDYKPRALRLFRKDKGEFTSKKVDESVALKGKTGVLTNPLLHSPLSHKDMTGYVDIVVNRRSSYTAEDLYNMGRRVTNKNWALYFVLKPAAIFFQKFFLKRGFRAGRMGFFLSVFASFAYFVSYAKLWEKQLKEKEI